MKGTLDKAFGYKGDKMNLPVRDLAAALPFYQNVLGFALVSQDTQRKSAVLSRDNVQIGLSENGGDPTQDGCAFHATNVEALLTEFNAKAKTSTGLRSEWRDKAEWKVFFVVAPDGLCYWFGERQPPQPPLK